MNHFERSLDAYITGQHDPSAPFNQVEKTFECDSCGADVVIEVRPDFQEDDQTDPIFCDDCEKDIAEQFEKEEKESFKREEYRQEQEEAEEQLERERVKNDAIFHAMKELDGKL